MKKIKNLILVLVLFMCFNQCEKNQVDEGTSASPTVLTVEQAKAFVDEQKVSILALKSGNSVKQTIAIKANWEKAKSSSNDNVSVVETEILAMGLFGFSTAESMEAWKTTGNDSYLCPMSRLVVIKDKKTGQMHSFLMSIAADKQYMESKKFKLGKNTYLKRDNDLTGYVLYHSLTGEFVNGWEYCGGQITNSLNKEHDLDLSVGLKSAQAVVAIYGWQTQCSDWQTTGVDSDGDFTVIRNYCQEVLVVVGYIDIGGSGSSGYPGGGSTSSGGGGTPGGYNPPPTCNCPERCPICNKCLTVNLKSASLPGDGTTTPSDPCTYCSGHPVPNIDIDGYNQLNSIEKELIKEFPLEAIEISKNKDIATNMTINLFGHNGRNDCSDAFRHAYFQALNTKSIGSYITRRFSDAHESSTPSNLELEKNMDLSNNAMGIYLGETCNGCDLANKVMDSLRSGALYFLSPINYSDPNFQNTGGITSNTALISTSNCF